MSIKDVRNAIFTKLLSHNILKTTNTAIANAPFTPSGDVWYRISFLSGEPLTIGIGTEARERFVGIVQVDVYTKTGIGDVTPITKAAEVANLISRGTVLTSNGQDVLITKVWIDNADVEDGWYVTPVNFRWQAEIKSGGY